MKVFLDECVDRKFARLLPGHVVRTAKQMRWVSIKNGALLAIVAQHFDAFITVDRNLAYQQNVASLPVAVIVLRAMTNKLADLTPLAPLLLAKLDSLAPNSLSFLSESDA